MEFVKSLTVSKTVIHEPTFFTGEASGIYVEASIQYCEKTYNEMILSFVNNIRTRDGGTHETGFRVGITKAFNDHARMIGALKEKDANLDGADIREGITGVISVRIPERLLQFEGQTKNKLGTAEAKTAVESIVYEQTRFSWPKKVKFRIFDSECPSASKARKLPGKRAMKLGW